MSYGIQFCIQREDHLTNVDIKVILHHFLRLWFKINTKSLNSRELIKAEKVDNQEEEKGKETMKASDSFEDALGDLILCFDSHQFIRCLYKVTCGHEVRSL